VVVDNRYVRGDDGRIVLVLVVVLVLERQSESEAQNRLADF
jgi:hypothetical protein